MSQIEILKQELGKPYRDLEFLLHKNQVFQLKQWRNTNETNLKEREKILNQLLISVNAIANAMGTTG